MPTLHRAMRMTMTMTTTMIMTMRCNAMPSDAMLRHAMLCCDATGYGLTQPNTLQAIRPNECTTQYTPNTDTNSDTHPDVNTRPDAMQYEIVIQCDRIRYDEDSALQHYTVQRGPKQRSSTHAVQYNNMMTCDSDAPIRCGAVRCGTA